MMNRFKRDLSGKALFVMGIALIGISIFNLFEDPIVNQYYRMKRNIDRQISIPTQIPTNETTNDNFVEQTSNASTQPLTTELVDITGDEIFKDEGFLPLSVEVTTDPETTPEPTKENDVVPVRLSIPVIDLEADIVHAQHKEVVQGEKTYIQWLAPDEYAVGWHFDSAFLGETGNTVLNGHHNVFGKVFENLDKLVSGDEIFISGNDSYEYKYVVSNTMIFPERDVSFEKRLENARWILPSEDERITLITCWPYFSNTHRLVIVARPVESKPIRLPIDRQ